MLNKLMVDWRCQWTKPLLSSVHRQGFLQLSHWTDLLLALLWQTGLIYLKELTVLKMANSRYTLSRWSPQKPSAAMSSLAASSRIADTPERTSPVLSRIARQVRCKHHDKPLREHLQWSPMISLCLRMVKPPFGQESSCSTEKGAPCTCTVRGDVSKRPTVRVFFSCTST